MTRIQNKAIVSMDPPNNKTGGSFFHKKNTMPVLIACKGNAMSLLWFV
jgi:hypothetical protein